MTTRMLIDAGHPEETRVVVSDGHELQEFDVESSVKTQIKGNIYLAKVVRIEPSLQAAFVEYGGNRHGFLSFSEIHTDYFQVPVSDREELAAEQARLVEEALLDEGETDGDGETDGESAENGDENGDERDRRSGAKRRRQGDEDRPEAILHTAILRRGYRIQEVIRKNQVLLVQVTKEERGNKGAALTTYLSMAGRYCVLMPNTPRGGGISRKITDARQRRRLKEVAAGLEIPEGMGLIIRTAGQNRTKPEIRRDCNSLLKEWESLRDRTLKSTAPSLIHEEAGLIKRAIRDLYTKNVEEILVEGDEGYRTAKAYMKFLMPSHAPRVKAYSEGDSLFHHFEVEREIDAMHSPVVPLKSGGYLVINPTEALVVVDVNSGRSTRERTIEETALKTNLEAAQEIARQLRLRDLAGLVVIDFIDMDERRNDAAVERRVKEALKADRARIQVGRISGFGLLELSRQRLRPSLEEAISAPCPQCNGSGYMRSAESTALHVLRGIEGEAHARPGGTLRVAAPAAIALHILNHKRLALTRIESRYSVVVVVETDDRLVVPDYRIDTEESGAGQHADGEARPSGGARPRKRTRRRRRETAAEQEPKAGETAEGEDAEAESAEQGERRRRRRGRRGGRRNRSSAEGVGESAPEERRETARPRSSGKAPGSDDAGSADSGGESAAATPEERPEPARRRRSARKSSGPRDEGLAEEGGAEAAPAEPPEPARRRRSARKTSGSRDEGPAEEGGAEAAPAEPPEPARRRRSARKTSGPRDEGPAEEGGAEAAPAEPPEPARRRRSARKTSGPRDEGPAGEGGAEAAPEERPEPARRRRSARKMSGPRDEGPAEEGGAEATSEERPEPARRRRSAGKASESGDGGSAQEAPEVQVSEA